MSAPSPFSRRKLIVRSAASVLLPASLRSAPAQANFQKISSAPDSVMAFAESGQFELQKNGSAWAAQDVEVEVNVNGSASTLKLRAPKTALLRLHLRWQLTPSANLLYLGDHWERSYGDLEWRTTDPERVLPWYFLATDRASTNACGVKTAPGAFCFWQVDPAGVSLWLDIRNGGRGLQLGQRELTLATIVTAQYRNTKPFEAASQFCRRLCDKPRLPAAPVYGGNNWYYAYGKSSAEDIRSDSERIASFAPSGPNKPFMVIDDGWQPNPTAGPWSSGNAHFPDMPRLASDMRRIGVQPGLWVRPLFTKEAAAEKWQLQSPNARKELSANQTFTLDPTIPDAVAKVQTDIRTAVSWGYTLIKHDFSTYDLLGRWGSTMGAVITNANWSFTDRTRTNAEIICDFYRALRDAAGTALVLGCNTVGHLSAGLFELQRTGDDTSGRDWNRTRKMGVNTLAFRAPQHNAFFAIDADCVGLTREIAWSENRQWLDLLAHSGTPLFVSAAPDAVGPEQREALRAAFNLAAVPRPTAQPVDWLDNTEPQHWNFGGDAGSYDWFGTEGASPFPV